MWYYKQNCKPYMVVFSNNASGMPPVLFQRLGWLQKYAHVRCASLAFEENVATRNPVFLFIFWLICFICFIFVLVCRWINLCFISVSFYVVILSFKTSTNCWGKKNKKIRNTPFYPGGEEQEDFMMLDTTTRMELLRFVTTRENMPMQVFQIFTLSSPTTDQNFPMKTNGTLCFLWLAQILHLNNANIHFLLGGVFVYSGPWLK